MVGYDEDATESSDPNWSLSVLPLIPDDDAESKPEPVTTEEEAIAYLEELKAGYLGEGEDNESISELSAEIVSDENSAFSKAVVGSYMQELDDGALIYHKDKMIINEAGEIIIVNFLMRDELYKAELSDEVDNILGSVKFKN